MAVLAVSLNFLHDFTLFVVDIHQIRLISLFRHSPTTFTFTLFWNRNMSLIWFLVIGVALVKHIGSVFLHMGVKSYPLSEMESCRAGLEWNAAWLQLMLKCGSGVSIPPSSQIQIQRHIYTAWLEDLNLITNHPSDRQPNLQMICKHRQWCQAVILPLLLQISIEMKTGRPFLRLHNVLCIAMHICIICIMYYALYINLPHFSFCPVWTPHNLICISTQPFLSFLISFYFISSDRSIPSVLFQIISISPQFKVNYDTFHYIQGYILNWALGFPDRSKFPIFLRSVCPIKSIGQTYKRC